MELRQISSEEISLLRTSLWNYLDISMVVGGLGKQP